MANDDDSEFSGLIPGVKRLHHDRVNPYQQRSHKPFTPRSRDSHRTAADPMPSSVAPARDSHFNTGLQRKLQRRIRHGEIRPEAILDLHGYRQDAALAALQAFVADAAAHGQRMILIIHGQGFRSQSDAVLKPLVQRWLDGHSQVLGWCPAQARDGARGASYVYLRSS